MRQETKEAELEKMEELRKIIEASPLTQKIKEEKATVTLSTRQGAAGKIEQLKQEAEAVILGLEAELASRVVDLAQYDEKRKVILDKVVTARVVLAQERQRIDYEMRQAETVLLSNYDPAIDNAKSWFSDKHAALCRKTANTQTHKMGTNMFTMTKQLITFSNARSIASAVAYCMNSIRALEAMKFEPVLDTDRIEALKKGIPDTDEMIEVTGEKPLSRINIDPRSLLPSDSEMDWKFSKLMEKLKRS